MSRVSANPERLRKFLGRLKRFNRTLTDEFSGLRSDWRGLGDDWTDAKYRELGQALEEIEKGIKHYLAVTPAHEKHLEQLIKDLDGFNSRRI